MQLRVLSDFILFQNTEEINKIVSNKRPHIINTEYDNTNISIAIYSFRLITNSF